MPSHIQRLQPTISQSYFSNLLLWSSLPSNMDVRARVGEHETGFGCDLVLWPCYRYRAKE